MHDQAGCFRLTTPTPVAIGWTPHASYITCRAGLKNRRSHSCLMLLGLRLSISTAAVRWWAHPLYCVSVMC